MFETGTLPVAKRLHQTRHGTTSVLHGQSLRENTCVGWADKLGPAWTGRPRVTPLQRAMCSSCECFVLHQKAEMKEPESPLLGKVESDRITESMITKVR
eukprot:2852390-Amphidinium_carterae.1